jgi:hypothetical protein
MAQHNQVVIMIQILLTLKMVKKLQEVLQIKNDIELLDMALDKRRKT